MFESIPGEGRMVGGSEPRGGPAADRAAGRADAAERSDTECVDTECVDPECVDPEWSDTGWSEAVWFDTETIGGSQPSAQEEALVQRLNAEAAANRRHAESDDADWGQRPSSVEDDPFLRLRAPKAEDLAAHENGPELAFRLAEVDPDAVDDYTAVEVVAGWSRLVSWAQAGAARAAADLAERDSMTIVPAAGPSLRARGRQVRPISAAAHEIAMRLVISRRGAQGLIDTGRAISGPLAPVGDALADGLIDLPRARAFVEGLDHVAVPVLLEVQDAVLPTAPGRTVRQVRNDIARALISTDREEAVRRHRVERDRRRVCHPTPFPDGMAGIWAVLPAPDAVALDVALDAAARTARNAGDPRSTDQLRADVLASVGYSALATGWFGSPPDVSGGGAQPPAGAVARGARAAGRSAGSAENAPADPVFRVGSIGRRPAQIRVTVPLADLLPDDPGRSSPASPPTTALHVGEPRAGVVQAPTSDSPTTIGAFPSPGDVAELDGYGPITPDVARALALGGVWRRLVTDPGSGVVRDVGRTRYEPPPDLAELIRARDRTCTRPGCNAGAQGCDLDHTTPYHLGGHTAHWNLGALCSTDHALKSAGGVRVRQVEPGTFDFEMPSGHRYRRRSDGSTTMRHRSDGDIGPPPY